MAGTVKKIFEADIAIAGAGPGGCVLARDLSALGYKVVLLEKGGKGESCSARLPGCC